MTSKILAAVPAIAVLLLSSAHAAAEPAPFGQWVRGDGKARVRIERCGSDLCAVNTWIKPGVDDEKVGDKLVMSVAPKTAALWSGTAWDPQRRLGFKISMDVTPTHMTTHGCVLAGLLCKDMGWTRFAGE